MAGKRAKRQNTIALWLGGIAAALAVALIICLFALSDGVLLHNPGIDPSSDLPINIRQAEDFTIDDNGHVSYPGAIAGIDVSAHQGEIDWDRVRAAGMQFAIIRCGFRGYSEGTLNEDERFRENIDGARDAGLSVGVYFYSQALSEDEAVEEAEYVLSLLNGRTLALPVFFDWEETDKEGSRTRNQANYEVGQYALAFCKRIEEAGYHAGTYFNQIYGYTVMQLEQLKSYALWLAEYRSAPQFLYDIKYWQYTGKGRVDGVSTDVDLDLLFPD